jgi:NAD(P)-dependent dehydrogenase (short-subunit alcohol dehydrogenase family)
MVDAELASRVAMVTGGGSGIGRGAALALARLGAAVAVCDIDLAAAAETTREIAAQGGQALDFAMDVGELESVTAGFGAVSRSLGPVDILVHSAGGNEHSPDGNTVARMDLAAWDRIIHLNLNGTLYVSRTAAAGMTERGWGRIVIVGSAAGYRLGVGGGAYAVSKAAIAAFTKILAREVASRHVTVNSIVPFFVDTPMLRRQFPDDESLTAQMRNGPLANPMHVVLQVQDQVEAILYLCRDSGRYVTGQGLHVNGGAVMP